jgi:hypothetical protein
MNQQNDAQLRYIKGSPQYDAQLRFINELELRMDRFRKPKRKVFSWKKQWQKELKPFMGRDTAKRVSVDGRTIFPQRSGLGRAELMAIKQYAGRLTKQYFTDNINQLVAHRGYSADFPEVLAALTDAQAYEHSGYKTTDIKGRLRDFLPARFYEPDVVDIEEETAGTAIVHAFEKIGEGIASGGVEGAVIGAGKAIYGLVAPAGEGLNAQRSAIRLHALINSKKSRKAALAAVNNSDFFRSGDGRLVRQIYIHRYGADSLNSLKTKKSLQKYESHLRIIN